MGQKGAERLLPFNMVKIEEKSVKYRLLGNRHYQKAQDKDALQNYYLALDEAPVGSNSYFQAMCNIAVTLVNLGFAECAETHMKRLLDKETGKPVIKQVANVVKKLNSSSKSTRTGFFESPTQILYKTPNKLYPQLSSAVNVSYNKSRGRHLVAAEDIPVGSVIGLEVPHLLVTVAERTNCHYCGRILPLSYIPCEKCNVRFCNESCRDEGQYFHRFLDHSSYVRDHFIFDLAVRIVMTYSRFEVENCFQSPPKRENVNTQYDDKTLSGIFCLQSYSLLEKNSRFDEAISALMEYPEFIQGKGYDVYDEKTLKSLLAKTLKAIVTRIELNAHLIYHDPCPWIISGDIASNMLNDAEIPFKHSLNTKKIELLNTSETSIDVTAVCLLPVASIANHSCVPNLITSFCDKDERCIVIRTSRDVYAGEELLHNYGPILGLHTFEQRQERLQRDFMFICKCEACVMAGEHPIDKRLSNQRCCLCQIFNVVLLRLNDLLSGFFGLDDFRPSSSKEFCCKSCANDTYKQVSYFKMEADLKKDIAALESDNWNWSDVKAYDRGFEVFQKAQAIYYVGNRMVEEFVTKACLAAMNAGYYHYGQKYIEYLSEMRKVIFHGRYCPFLANAFLLPAVFDIVLTK
uniref:SET domain-containing protein n=1 Tax=Syphacia muris TaxID=451379 RepID=A0A0N5ANH1_9BILA